MVKLSRRSQLILLTIAGWLISFTANAGNLTATVSSNQVTKAEVFQLRLTYDAKVDSDSLNFAVLEQNFFLGQPSFGSSLNYVNGKRSSRSEWTIALKAKQLGTLTIPSFSIEGNQSQPINIQVSQDNDLPKPSELAQIQSQLEKKTLYPNESTQLKTRLIIKADPRRLQNVQISPPEGDGFTVKQVGQPNQYQTVINGLEATVVDQTFDITATQSGEQQLNSLGFSATFVFGSNRSGTTKLLPVKIAAESLSINVKPKPTDSNNAWLPTTELDLSQTWIDAQGNALDSNTQQLAVKVGDSITRQLTLTIQGIEAENFPNILVSYPQAVRQYAEKPQFTQLENGATQMTVQQVLIAQHQGNVSLPPVVVEWFNTQAEQKQLSQTSGLKLEIEAAAMGTPQPVVITKDQARSSDSNSGIWPYLTALFATLWVLTLVWHIKSRINVMPAKHIGTEEDDLKTQLIEAVKSGDHAKTQFLATRWLKNQTHKSAATINEIHQELQAMAASQYGNQSPAWSNKTLIKLIHKLDKQTQDKSTKYKLPKL